MIMHSLILSQYALVTDRRTNTALIAIIRVAMICCLYVKELARQVLEVTRSVASGFDRHGMFPPASDDTGTAFCFLN